MSDPFTKPLPDAEPPAEPSTQDQPDAATPARSKRRKPSIRAAAAAAPRKVVQVQAESLDNLPSISPSDEPTPEDLQRIMRQDLLFDPISLAGRSLPVSSAPAPEIVRAAETPPGKIRSAEPAPPVPQDFVTDAEHPVLPIPFSVQMQEARLEGVGLSVTAAYVTIAGPLDPLRQHHREVVRLLFDFNGFSLAVPAEMVVSGSRRPGEMTLQFIDPLGPHLPQLRHVINSFIAGDLVSLGGLLSYTGPTKPKAAKTAEGGDSLRMRIRSLAVAALSLALIVGAGVLMLNRATQSYEIRPVFVDRQGHDMRATTAGQVSYLNPDAKAGEVVFSINSNTGDALNFQLPCNCEVSITEGVFEGATVLPIDLILTFFESNLGVRVQTQLSIEGLARVMDGDRAYLDMDDGRTIPVRIAITSASNAAAQRGDLFVPVNLIPADGALGQDDIGKVARLRLATPWLPDLPFTSGEDS